MALDPAPPETPTDPDAPDTAAHDLALDRFQLCVDAFDDQRERELDDLRFIDERGAQWPDEVRASRAGNPAGSGLPPAAARPCLEVNLLPAPVQQIINTRRPAKRRPSFA